MVNTNEAIENVKSLARVFQSVIDLADALGDVANVEQTIAEKRALVSRANTELERANQAAAKATQDAKATAEHANQLIANADEYAQGALAKARTDANSMLDEALKKIELEHASAQEKRTLVFSECQEMEARRNLMQAELRTLQDKIDNAKAAMAKMLGA